jgi:hypothetical protein
MTTLGGWLRLTGQVPVRLETDGTMVIEKEM